MFLALAMYSPHLVGRDLDPPPREWKACGALVRSCGNPLNEPPVTHISAPLIALEACGDDVSDTHRASLGERYDVIESDRLEG